MTDGLWYVVREGTNIRWSFDTKNANPRVYDTEEIAKREINRDKEYRPTSSTVNVPITVDEYDKKYSRFVDDTNQDHELDLGVRSKRS